MGHATPPKYETLKQRYPNLPDEILHKMVRWHVHALLNKPDQAKFIRGLSTGLDVDSIYSKYKLHKHKVLITRYVNPEFDAECKRVLRMRTHRVEKSLERMSNGFARQTTIIYKPVLDNDGRPTYDKNGKQVFFISSKEVTKLAPNPTLLQFYLKSHKPDVYGLKATEQQVSGTMPTEELRDSLKENLNAFGILKAK